MLTFRTRLERLETKADARHLERTAELDWGKFFGSMSEEEVDQYADLCQRVRERGLGGIPKLLAGEDVSAYLARVSDYPFAEREGADHADVPDPA